jgi:uncharacterized membrane protein
VEPLAEVAVQGPPLWPVLLILPLLAFLVWMAYDMTRNDRLSSDTKARWAVAFLLLNVFAAGLYYVSEYRQRPRRR